MMKRGLGLLCAGLLLGGAPSASGAQELLGEPVQRASAESLPAGAPERIVPENGEIRLRVDLSDRKLYLEQAGGVVRSYDVAVGKPEHPTPQGSFKVGRLVWNPRWVPPNSGWARGKKPREPGDPNNPMGRVKLFFQEPDYYIHGTNAEESLGSAASHGCVRMRNADVIDLAQIVMENGGEPRPPGWFRRVLNRFRSTKEVRLSEPVRVVVEP